VNAVALSATRDLVDLMEKGALVRTGELRHARYNLSVPLNPGRHVTIGENGGLLEGQGGSRLWLFPTHNPTHKM
jgi:hypothetical protein